MCDIQAWIKVIYKIYSILGAQLYGHPVVHISQIVVNARTLKRLGRITEYYKNTKLELW